VNSINPGINAGVMQVSIFLGFSPDFFCFYSYFYFMAITCLNCGTIFADKYCPHCGQKSEVKKLSWHSLWEEIFHFFTHIEKGFLRTSKQLIICPHKVCKEYLDGKRKQYYKPVSFLLVWITIFTLIYHGVHSFTHYTYVPRSGSKTSFFNFGIGQFRVLGDYRSIIELTLLPVSAFISWLFIGRSKLNYPEVLTVFFYFIAFLFIWMSIQYVAAVIFHFNFKTAVFDMVSTGGFLVWFVIGGYLFYRQYHIKHLVIKIILSLTIGSIVYFLLMGVIVNLLVNWHL
jgi:hypothetical protein